MTCIVGLSTEDGTVYIGADSAGTRDSGLQVIREDEKVFFLNQSSPSGDGIPTLLAGGTSSFRMLQLLRYALEVPPYDPTLSPEKYLVTTFIDAVRTCFKEGGYDKKEDGEEQGGDLLVGWQGKLYHIEEDYQVGKPAIGYDAVGSGNMVALGVLFATRDTDIPSKKRILLALEAAAYHCRGVRSPFLIESVRKEEGTDETTKILYR